MSSFSLSSLSLSPSHTAHIFKVAIHVLSSSIRSLLIYIFSSFGLRQENYGGGSNSNSLLFGGDMSLPFVDYS